MFESTIWSLPRTLACTSSRHQWRSSRRGAQRLIHDGALLGHEPRRAIRHAHAGVQASLSLWHVVLIGCQSVAGLDRCCSDHAFRAAAHRRRLLHHVAFPNFPRAKIRDKTVLAGELALPDRAGLRNGPRPTLTCARARWFSAMAFDGIGKRVAEGAVKLGGEARLASYSTPAPCPRPSSRLEEHLEGDHEPFRAFMTHRPQLALARQAPRLTSSVVRVQPSSGCVPQDVVAGPRGDVNRKPENTGDKVCRI